MSADDRAKGALPGKKSQVSRVGKYILLDTLGQGAFGKVKLAVNEETGREYAIKIMAKQDIKAHELTLQVRREIAVMKALRHPNIVNLHEVLNSSKNLYMVMDLVTGGELFDVVAAQKRLQENQARSFFQQLVDGIEYCHSRRVYHRDLKPENLLVSEDKKTLKITDFGLSSIKEQNASSELLHTIMGSPHYIAPEIITSAANGYEGNKVDTWASGIILFGMLAGYLPFDNPDTNELYRAIVHNPAEYPKHFSYDVINLLRAMLQKDPKNRADMKEVKTFPWFKVDYEPSMPVTPRVEDRVTKKKGRKKNHRKKHSDAGVKPASSSFDSATEGSEMRTQMSMESHEVEGVTGTDVEMPKQWRLRSRLGNKIAMREGSDVLRRSSYRRERTRDQDDRGTSKDLERQKSDSSASDLRRQLSSQSSSTRYEASANESEKAPPQLGGANRKKSFVSRRNGENAQRAKPSRRGFLNALSSVKQHPFRRNHEKKQVAAIMPESVSDQFVDCEGGVTKVESGPLSLNDLTKATAKFALREVSYVSPAKGSGPILFASQSHDAGGHGRRRAVSSSLHDSEFEADRERSSSNKTQFVRRTNGSQINSEACESPWSDCGGLDKQKQVPKHTLDVAGTLFADLTSPTSPPSQIIAENGSAEFARSEEDEDHHSRPPAKSLPSHAFNTPTHGYSLDEETDELSIAFSLAPRKSATFAKSWKGFAKEGDPECDLNSPRILQGPSSMGEKLSNPEAVSEKQHDTCVDRVIAGTAAASIFKPSKFQFPCHDERTNEVADSPHVLCPPRYIGDNEYPQWCLDSSDVFADAEDEPRQVRARSLQSMKVVDEEYRAHGEASITAQAATKKPIFAPLNLQLERTLSVSKNEVSLEATVPRRLRSLTLYPANCE